MPPPPPPGEPSRDAVWKLNLLSLSTDRSRTPDSARESLSSAASPPVSSPSLSISPLAHAASMKKRLSDSISDSWTRRRPSIQQSTAAATLARSKDSSASISSSYGSSKSRSRSSSATAGGVVNATASASTYSPRVPPVLTSYPSSATLASTVSASSSLYNPSVDLPRQDSYSDLYIARGLARPPLSSPTNSSSAKDPYSVDSPTLYEPVRHASTRSIAHSLRDVDEANEVFQNSSWEDLGSRGVNPGRGPPPSTAQGIRPGLVRRISDSKRIMASDPLAEEPGEKTNGGIKVMRHRKIYTSEQALLGPPLSADPKRESSTSAANPRVYDHSSDEESTVSSVGAASVASSSRQVMPHSIPYSTNKRFSRNAYLPPFEYSADKASDNGSTPSPSRPQSSAGVSTSRAVTTTTMTLPLKLGPAATLPSSSSSSISLRSTSTPLDPSLRQESNTRLSSLTDKAMSPGPYQQPASWSRATAGLTRSDSQTSIASAPATARTSGTSSTATGPTSQAVNAQRSKLMAARDRRAQTLQNSMAAISPTGEARIKRGPPPPDPSTAPTVAPAPSSGMYWYKAPVHGIEHTCWRAHACALVGSNVYVFGGADSTACFNELYVFDADAMSWSKPEVHGDIPPSLRAMTMTAVRSKLVIFGGGDGPHYYNTTYVFDTVTCKFTRPRVASSTMPCPRRAHSACYYKNNIYIFGGGDGFKAKNDVWRLDVSDLNRAIYWEEMVRSTDTNDHRRGQQRPASSSSASAQSSTSPPSSSSGAKKHTCPPARGYHTGNMIGPNMVIYGGSNGKECFSDVWVFNVQYMEWKSAEIAESHKRLSHSATVIGSYLFVVGGHNGVDYVSDVLLLNLVTMAWDTKRVYGVPPSGRGYHCAVMHDSRLFIFGGYDGKEVFNDTYILELAVSSYYSQISQFSVVVPSPTAEAAAAAAKAKAKAKASRAVAIRDGGAATRSGGMNGQRGYSGSISAVLPPSLSAGVPPAGTQGGAARNV